MNITVVCDILGKEDNGTTIASMNLIRYLSKNHNVKVLCCDPAKKDLFNYFVTPQKNFGKPINDVMTKMGFKLASYDSITIKKAVVDADIVHVILPFELGTSATKFANKLNIPVTAGFHLMPENMTAYLHIRKLGLVNSAIYRYFWNNCYRYVNAIHYPTKFAQHIFEKHIRRKTNGHVVSNGVISDVKKMDVAKPNKYKDKILILCCGRFAPEKSQDTLIKAVLHSKYENKIQLIFAGQGQNLELYQDLCKNLTNKPVFKRMKHDDLVNVINYCDMFVHPAIIEIEGISVLEAIKCGKLIIVSDSKTSATKSFALTKKCVFKKRKYKDLCKKIEYWIEHPELKKVYEKKYEEMGKLYKHEDCMRRTEEFIINTYNECQEFVSSKMHRKIINKVLKKSKTKKNKRKI